MPELPDVAIQKQYLDATALHEPIEDVTVRSRKILKGTSQKRLRDTLRGSVLKTSETHGKYLFVGFENSKKNETRWLMLHFGMTGFLDYGKEAFGSSDNKNKEHARLEMTMRDGYHLSFVNKRLLGQVALIESPDALVRRKKLGPDAMQVDEERFREILSGHSAAVKSTLMNQRAISGLGNIYSDEILYQTGIHPETRSDELSSERQHALYETMRSVIKAAIEHRADPSKMPDDFLLPHRDEGAECPRCSGSVKKIRVSGRSTYYCPECQTT
jgi:formamidopyrimidine-DNA glycosylase